MQDSQNAETKAVSETQKTLQRLDGQLGPSLFGALVLVAATVAVYWPALNGGFIWDDDVMLRNNPYVKSPGGLYYIWCSTRLPDFFPLTSTSLWLEWRLWGIHAAGYHLINVLLHAASAVILWRVLGRLAVPAAWLAALLFAVHPVNVESVAWITERKNTLSMVCYLLSLLLYLRFDQQSKVQSLKSKVGIENPATRNTQHATRFYLLSLAAFLLALLAKTSVVMMPFVLLGCAWWWRGRIERRDALRALPFFGLSVAFGLITIWFQYHRAIGGEVVHSANFWARLAGAGWAIWFYLGKALFPWPLSFVYTRWEINAHSLLSYLPTVALVLSAGVLWHYRRTWGRAALFGLGYFVVMLVPVLGFVNIYFQRYSLVADHWQYYSIIGVIALAVGAASRLPRMGFRLAAGAAVVALSVLTWRQASLYESPVVLWQDTLAKNPGCWMAHNNLGLLLAASADAAGPRALEQAMAHYQDSLRLKPDQVEAHINLGSALMKAGRLDDARAQFEAAAKVNAANGMVFYNLGLLLEEQGKPGEAQAAYRRAIEVWPDYAEPHNNLGAALQAQGDFAAAEAEFAEAVRLQPGLFHARNNLALVLLARGQTAEALDQLHQALRLEPNYPESHNNLGKALAEQGKLAEAKAEFAEAIRLKPGYADAQYNLGNTLLMMGKPAEAIPPYTAAVQARPDFAEAHYQLGTLLAGRKQTADALSHFREAVRLKPDWLEALNNLAWLLATQPDEKLRNAPEALRLATHAVALTRTNHPGPLDTLAAAYAAAGRFPEAVTAAQKAIDLAAAAGQAPLAAEIQKRRQSYLAGQPFQE
jgi:protein O-mannosyl-transferase